MTDSAKETVKLRANYLNGLSLIFFGIGGLAPVMVALQQPDWKRVVISLVFLWAGGMSSWELHQKAIAELKKLE